MFNTIQSVRLLSFGGNINAGRRGFVILAEVFPDPVGEKKYSIKK